jgi:YNFM family putative membrane transporter
MIDKLHLRRAFALLSVAAFSSSASLRICDPMLPALADEFATTLTQAALTISVFALAYGSLQLLYGPLGDRFGKFRMISLAALLSAIGNMAAAATSNLDHLLIARAMSGATVAGIIPLSMAWLGDAVAYEERLDMLSRFMRGQILGLIAGQLLGGLLTDMVGWRWAFVLLSLLQFATGVLLWRTLKEIPELDPAHSHAEQQVSSLQRMQGVVSTRWARIVLVTVAIESMAVFSLIAFMPTYLHQHFNLSLTWSGAVSATFGAGGLVYTFIARRLLGMYGEANVAGIAGVVIGVASLTLMVANTWVLVLLCCVVCGFGYFTLHNTLQANATQMAPEARGTAVSLFAASFFVGQSVGVTTGAHIAATIGPVWLFVVAALLAPATGLTFRYLRKRHSYD